MARTQTVKMVVKLGWRRGAWRHVLRDGVDINQLRCPACELWADLDEDQFRGRVSIDHTNMDCEYHETRNIAQELQSAWDRTVIDGIGENQG